VNVNLHELANAPGAGKAQEALRKAGHWKLTAEDIAELPRWDVTVDLTVSATETISVAASTKEEAARLARKFDDWDVDGTVEEVRVLSVVADTCPIGDPQMTEGED
jgi:hypothetical protein